MELNDQLTVVLDALGERVDRLSPDDLARPTPCVDWTVRDLLNHVVGGGHMFAACFRGETVDLAAAPPDLIGDDPAQAWKAARSDFEQEAAKSGAMDQIITLPFAVVPAPVAMSIGVFDLLTHTWDLSQSTGQAFAPDDELVEAAIGYAQMIIQPEARGVAFGQPVVMPEGATPLQRLVAFTGRQP